MCVKAICLNCQRSSNLKNGPVNREGITWVKPAMGYVKVNVDSCFHVETGDGSIGVVIRDG